MSEPWPRNADSQTEISNLRHRIAALEDAIGGKFSNRDFMRSLEFRIAALESANNQLINEIRALNGLERIDFERMEREAKESYDQQVQDLLDHFDQERK